MPKKKKSSGFTHRKSGKCAGRGFKGRRKLPDDKQGDEVSNNEGPSTPSGLSQYGSDFQKSINSTVTGFQVVTVPGLPVSGPGDNIQPSASLSPTLLTADSNIINTPHGVETTRYNAIESDPLIQKPHPVDKNGSILQSSSCPTLEHSNDAFQDQEAARCNVVILHQLNTATDPEDASIPQPSSPSLTCLSTEPSIYAPVRVDAEKITLNVTSMSAECTSAIKTYILNMLNAALPLHWKCILGQEGFHVVLMSRSAKKIAIQREVYASFLGNIEVFVHRKEISEDLYKDCLKEVKKLFSISESVKDFCDNILKVVSAIRKLEICAGSDYKFKFEEMWAGDTSGVIDNNPYDESRYKRAFRSSECILLVPVRTWRCHECNKINKRFREKMKHYQDDDSTKNEQLDPKMAKRELVSASKNSDCLSTRVSQALKQEGVYIEKEYAEDLTNILRAWGNLTPTQQMFIQQQVKSASCKGASRVRWHPTLIRLALSIQSTSNAACMVLRDSGMTRLPCQKTLLDYFHAVPRSEGIFTERLHVLKKSVQKLKDEHEKYFSLLFDEIYISQNLVYRKSDGSLVGYVKLEEVEVEMQDLENAMNNKNAKLQSAVATQLLAYLIKGCTNAVKGVVAVFPNSCLTKEQLFSRTWDVVRACERERIKILAMVCCGSRINRSFIAMHTPASPSAHGVVFDTVNLCVPFRKIYFIVDPPYLLKAIRNCFAKSGTDKRCTRLMKIGKEFIQWETIERLLADVDNTSMCSSKLKSQNVFLNSYTCMKVSYAAQVMSRTVAMDLKDKKWPGTGATVHFILSVNNFFDCLNGSHMDIARKEANDRLKPYTDINDERFNELQDFEKYIRDWEKDVQNLSGVSESEKAKMTLSPQTIEGISITVNGFVGVVQFLLTVGAELVHGRSFCKDPLEQYFSKQTVSLGTQNNPTVDSFLDTKISNHRDYSVKRRSGNTSSIPSAMEIDSEPLPKRQKVAIERRSSF